MKSDIDTLMQINEVDALLVVGPAQNNPAMVYLTGGGHITYADLIKKRGETAAIIHGPMERDEAAKTGLNTVSNDRYMLKKYLKQTNGDQLQAMALRYQQILVDQGVTSGKVLLYGRSNVGPLYSTLTALHLLMPDLYIAGDIEDAVLPQAMATKSPDEIERIRKMGKITTEVVAQVADFLCAHPVRNEVLIKPDGQPLRIVDVKNKINLWLAERGASNPEDTIFAIGRDAGVPHSSGSPQDAMRLGQTIVFDIYPCEAGGGYYYDFTRTWCLGYAPDETLELYEQVHSVYQQIVGELEAGAACQTYQKRVCDLFVARGHPTIQENPMTTDGYVHSLGHGVGLNVHEKPWFGSTASPSDVLSPGSVFTIEPGLYYPERGLGVRLEDTLLVRSDGQMEILAPYPKELILPVKS